MRWNVHGIIIEGITEDATLRNRWQTSFASRPRSASEPDIRYRLDVVTMIPDPPAGDPQYHHDDLIDYYVDGAHVVAHLPRYGQLEFDLAAGRTKGRIVPAALHTYGVVEDLIAVGLSPHLRRRDLYLIHAFAAALNDRAVLLVGGIGAGKTTTGLALLDAGWQLLSNDSPILTPDGTVLGYPGLLSAYPDTFMRFDTTAALVTQTSADETDAKITIAAESLWPDVWCDRAPAGAVCFLQIEARQDHKLTPLAAPEALRRLLPHAIERWDRQMIPGHLRVLSHLLKSVPAYVLHLGPDVSTIPALLIGVLEAD